MLVSVKAAAVNGIDWKIREGYMRERFKLTLPATLGIELASVVVRTGEGVRNVETGDRVVAALGSVASRRQGGGLRHG
ncbi:alcohol dehydrogenase catalytic domain-containing protein [Agrobacterium fabrum]|uniref:alcohol dehydrogenase catalytic domain-containing protein n=1 Tax=Agrobacterium fabrum TaxID=1176649 RepID=UPI003B9E4727